MVTDMLPALISLVSLIVALIVYRSARAFVQQMREQTLHQMQMLEKRVAVLTEGGVGMAHRLVGLEHRLLLLQTQQEDLGNTDNNFAYSQALQMFKQGADVATVASNCGFSNSEAELMALVQKKWVKNGRSGLDVVA